MAAIELLDNVSSLILRVNPKLTTNVKIVVDTSNNIYLESFDANDELAKLKYKAFKVGKETSYEYDLRSFYQGGTTPSSISFDLARKYSDNNIYSNYGKQFEFMYNYGAEGISSKFYTEEFGILAPLWIDKIIPDYFIIFRIDEPVAVNNKNATTEDQYKSIVEDPANFREFILKKSTIIKTFDLTSKSQIGQYIRNYSKKVGFPDSPLIFNADRESPSLFRGIDISNGGFIEASEWIYKDFIGKDKTVIENDYFLTTGFERNNIAVANLLNLQFLFDDTEVENWHINRYFGLYVNSIEEGTFRVSGAAMLADKQNEIEQLQNINIINKVEENNAKNIIQSNADGIAMYINPDTVNVVYDVDAILYNQTPLSYVPTSSEVNDLLSIFYVKDKNNNFHNLKIDSTYSNGKLKLSDTFINWKNFTGFNELIVSERAYVSDKGGKANIVFKVLNNPPIGDRLFVTLPTQQVYSFTPSNILPGETFTITDSDGHSISVNAVTADTNTLCQNLKTAWQASVDPDFQNYTIFVKNGTLIVREKTFTGIDNNFVVQIIPYSPYITPQSSMIVKKIDSAELTKYTITANDTIATDIGKAYQRYFNQNGTFDEVAKSIVAAINNIDNRLFVAIAIKDTVVILSKFEGERFNDILLGHDNNFSFGQYAIFAENIGLDNDEWLIRNCTGGVKNSKSRVSIDINAFNQFNIPGMYLRSNNTINDDTELDFVKIKRVSYYVDEPIEDINGNITGFTNFDNLCTVICDSDKNIYIDSMNRVHLYDLYNIPFGRFSIFPIKDLDFDFYSTEYGDEKELIIEKNFYGDFGTSSLDLTQPDIEDWVLNNEYTSLIKVLDVDDVDIVSTSPKIDCEYDRLQENYIKELSTPSRIVPFINKWVYLNGKDVRENDYRLNISEAFGTYNFSPSEETIGRDVYSFSHEWLYLQKTPPYYGLYNIEELDKIFSYFNDYIDIETGIKRVSDDYFKSYFVVDGLILPLINSNSTSIYDGLNTASYPINTPSNYRQIKKQLRYSIFNDGTSEAFSEAFFRGIKVIIKERTENVKQVNYNVNKLQYKKSNKYNGYRFSAVLIPTDGSYQGKKRKNIDIDIIENKKFKTITLVVYINILDPLTFNGKYLDRTILYGLKSKYETIDATVAFTGGIDFADIKLSGAIDFRSPSGTDPVILNSMDDINGNQPNFLEEIKPNPDGSYNPIWWQTWYYINELTPLKILSNYEIMFKNDGSFTSNSYDNFTSNSFIQQSNCIYRNGGYTFWNNRLENIGYSEIAKMINQGSPIINYITVNEDGSETLNNFILQLSSGNTIMKPQYLKPSIDENKPVQFNLEKNIGYELDIQDNAYITPLIRHSGKYTLKLKDIISFVDIYPTISGISLTQTDIFSKKRNYTRYCNTQFKIDDTFGKIDNLYYHKINEISNNGILELNDTTAYQPLYPLVGEIAIDKKQHYIFSSNWDSGYFKRSMTKKNTTDVIGTRNINEGKSFLASKIMKISNKVVLEKFNSIQAVSMNELDLMGLDVLKPENLYTLVYFNDTDTLYIDIYIDKKLTEQLSADGVYDFFNTFISPTFGYGKQDSITDDVDGYIQNNILPRYILDKVRLYVGKSTDSNYNTMYPLINSTLTDSEKKISGMKFEDNFRFIKLDANNNFNIRVIYNKIKGYYYSVAPSIEILKK